MYRILFDNVISEKETGRTAEYMGLFQQNRKFCVLIFRMLFPENLETNQLALLNTCLLSLMEVLEKELPDCLYANTGENQVSLIMNMEEQEEKIFETADGGYCGKDKKGIARKYSGKNIYLRWCDCKFP